MLTTPKPPGTTPTAALTRGQPPSYGPGFTKRIARVFKIPLVASGTSIDYDRGVLNEQIPQQLYVISNSRFQSQARGPIRWFYFRPWYWRNVSPMNPDTAPLTQVPMTVPGGQWVPAQPGGTIMTARPRLVRTILTPGYTVQPPTVMVQQ
jgi:hypothetical protein